VKTKNKMIGVGVFFSDVHQPNKDGEQRHEEENHEYEASNVAGAESPDPYFAGPQRARGADSVS